jgi:hypothetical protein
VGGLAHRIPMYLMRQSWHLKLQSQLGMHVQDSNTVGAQGSRYPAMSVLFTQHPLQDSKLEYGEEQAPLKGQ